MNSSKRKYSSIIFAVLLASPSMAAQPERAIISDSIKIEGTAQNPEGIEYDKNDGSFLLSSINAAPVIKVSPDGAFRNFTSGEKFPLSTAGLQVDYKNNRLLAAAFNGAELFDNDPKTKGTAHLRIYNLKTGVIQKDIDLSPLAPDASAYFANDVAVDDDGNAYVSDWYAKVIYKVDLNGNASLFWVDKTGIPGGPNGLDFHPDGYLLVSVLNVNDKFIYTDYGLVKIPVDHPESAKIVDIQTPGYSGFDGMVVKPDGNVVGITNNGITSGGNMFIELSGKNNWERAKVINAKAITPSTTVAVTPNNQYYVVNQNFANDYALNWTIERVSFQ